MPRIGYGMLSTRGTDRLAGQEAGGLGRNLEGRDLQMNALGRYDAILNGEGPSIAQEQLQQSSQQNAAQQRQMMAQARGGGIGAQMRQIGQVGSQAQQQTVSQMAVLRAQEQAQALGAYSGMAGQMQQAGQAEQMAYAGLLGNAQMGDMQAQGQAAQLKLAQDQFNYQKDQDKLKMAMDIAKGAGGAAMMFSDERVKDNIQSNPMAASEAVGVIDPKTYQYKEGYGPYGQRVGVTAQDLERTPMGAQLVHDTPAGKVVDVPGVASLSLAATADQEHRLREVEGLLGALGEYMPQRQRKAG